MACVNVCVDIVVRRVDGGSGSRANSKNHPRRAAPRERLEVSSGFKHECLESSVTGSGGCWVDCGANRKPETDARGTAIASVVSSEERSRRADEFITLRARIGPDERREDARRLYWSGGRTLGLPDSPVSNRGRLGGLTQFLRQFGVSGSATSLYTVDSKDTERCPSG